jgi:hypothetical protein
VPGSSWEVVCVCVCVCVVSGRREGGMGGTNPSGRTPRSAPLRPDAQSNIALEKRSYYRGVKLGARGEQAWRGRLGCLCARESRRGGGGEAGQANALAAARRQQSPTANKPIRAYVYISGRIKASWKHVPSKRVRPRMGRWVI